MKKILIPTDFSEEATNALKFASELNKKIKARILLFHSYFIPIPATDIPIVIPSDAEMKKEGLHLLQGVQKKFKNEFPEMDFDLELNEGFPESEIVNAVKIFKCDFIVMGTRGASGLKELLIGSNTAKVIEKSNCPVLAVPEKARMKGLNKIVFAANYGVDDFQNVFELIDFARLFNSEIVLLHVNTDSMDKTMAHAELEGFRSQLMEQSKYPKISFEVLDAEDVYLGLNFYLEKTKADMLAISMRHRSFVQRVFSRGITKKMVYHTHIPVLVFHTDID